MLTIAIGNYQSKWDGWKKVYFHCPLELFGLSVIIIIFQRFLCTIGSNKPGKKRKITAAGSATDAGLFGQ